MTLKEWQFDLSKVEEQTGPHAAPSEFLVMLSYWREVEFTRAELRKITEVRRVEHLIITALTINTI